MNLVLGTANFGFPYGVVNRVGRMTREQVVEMVRIAWECGIREFDTAQMYGDSETYLGYAFKELGIQDEVRVITKIDPNFDWNRENDIVKLLKESIDKLGVKKLYGVLLHREQLLNYSFIVKVLHKVKENEGMMDCVGASVYLPEYAKKALKDPNIDVVQFPSCVLDRRFERAGVFELAKERRKQIYLRNIFLQGLLLMKPEDCPIPAVRPWVERFDKLCLSYDPLKVGMAMSYLRKVSPDAKLIFGAETPDQIMDCVSHNYYYYGGYPLSDEGFSKLRSLFSDVPDEVLIPKMWRKDENSTDQPDS